MKVGSLVNWKDPDGGRVVPAVVTEVRGEIYSLAGQAGEEIEAFDHELSPRQEEEE